MNVSAKFKDRADFLYKRDLYVQVVASPLASMDEKKCVFSPTKGQVFKTGVGGNWCTTPLRRYLKSFT